MTRERLFIKEWRKKAGLTQTDVAKKLGFSSSQFISNCERGLANLPPKHVRKFCKLTGAPLQQFLSVKRHDFEILLQDAV